MVVSGSHRYIVHGLGIKSPVALPIPEDVAGPVDIEYRVLTDWRGIAGARHTRSDDPWFVEHWTDEGLVVEFPDLATFGVAHRTISLLSDESNDPDMVAHLLLDHIVPRVVALRGDLMLHAAGVVGPSGHAHLFVGPSGAGKSTLATALAVIGWPLLDDDGIRVIEVGGHWNAVPGYAGLRLLPDSARAVVPDLIAERPMAKDHPKHRYELGGSTLRLATSPVPIGSIYVIERGTCDPLQTSELGFADSITALADNAFRLTEDPTADAPLAFERASAVAATVPILLLRIPTGLHDLGSPIAELDRLDSELGAAPIQSSSSLPHAPDRYGGL